MQTYFRSIALIPRGAEGRASWFCRWSDQHAYFDFVTGERVREESFRSCIEREVVNTLGLCPKDFLVANMAQLELEFVAVLPGETEPSHVRVAFYMVRPYGQTSREVVESSPGGRWLTGRELLAGQTDDGAAVNPILTYLLKRSEVIRPW
jgi:hypothetical protein